MDSKLYFLQRKFIDKLTELDPDTKPLWGNMNVQQMIEHMSESLRIANGKNPHPLITPAEKVQAMKDFLASDKEFRPNTKNILMEETPPELRLKDKTKAIQELENEIKYFVAHFEEHPGTTVTNPFFGHLTFQEWIQLLHKHAKHHLKQFGVEV
ncbi:MAG: DUF1569 domain-containing protein [Bacteroidetes bacterium]|nr:DUF1569 domain-containing protein [Bacteroidota bacterium]MBL0139195.1 DUF1569 domain-containing protein [Bacteroidota bacterium]